MHFSTFISAAAFFELSIAGYILQDDYMTDFYGGFDFFTGADPTEGFVQYVDEATARQTNLINASSNTAAQWGVDFQNQTPDGRPSIRIESKKTYDSGLIVLDVEHMPFGCGTWPAFWTIGPNWPENGEIDILEGVNEMKYNGVTLHTGPGCSIGQDTAQFSGELSTPNCDIAAEGQGKNVGCSIKADSEQSYGAGLNKNRGGVYATQWTADAISVYFFPRGSIPTDVLGDNPEPSGWGLPVAKFSGSCDIESTFKEQKIIFDTTFCGQWAGSSSVWGGGTCAKKAPTCEEYVRDNPEAFAEAYWTINALKVYQDNGDATDPGTPVAPSQSIGVSVPVSVPTISNGYSASVAVPSASNIISPIPTSKVIPGVPSETITTPGTPLPTSKPIPVRPSDVPQVTRTQSGASSRRSTKPVNSQIAAPTGPGGMAGFQWPLGGAGQPGNTPKNTTTVSPPKATSMPIQSSTGAVVAPTNAQNIVQPSGVNDTPPAAPSTPILTSPAKATQTVYQTVYVTVPAAAADETSAPAAKKARVARLMREHRQRLTRHNARF